MSEQRATNRPRRTLLLLALLFLAPVAVAFYLYYSGWRSGGNVSHGELLTPARPLPDVALTRSDGTPAPKVFDDKWSLIFIGDGSCDDDCRRALYVTRQVRLSLNQNMDRVQRVFLYRGDCCEEPFFAAEQRGLIALDLDSAPGAELVASFESMRAPGNARPRIWLADPLGNVLLSYPVDAEPKGMIEDLKKLLKLSHIG